MIGGVSWESTALYYQLINESVRHQLGGLNSARLLISSMNYQELVDYKNQNNWDQIASILSETAHNLEKAGVDAVALCCNTLHKVASIIENRISIPFIHIADAAGTSLSQNDITTVGLLGTRFTMEDVFYSDYLTRKYAIKTTTPTSTMRGVIDDIIYKELCVGKCLNESKTTLLEAIELLEEQGAQAILLACTELGLLIQPEDYRLPIFDTTYVHAKKIAEYSLSR